MTADLLPETFLAEPLIGWLLGALEQIDDERGANALQEVLAPVCRGSVNHQASTRPASECFNDLLELRTALRARDAVAIEVSVKLLLCVRPQDALVVAEHVLAAHCWHRLDKSVFAAVDALNSEAGFRLLLTQPGASYVVRCSKFPGGGPLAFARLEASPALSWSKPEDVDPYERCMAEDLVSYVAEHWFDAALPLLLQLARSSPIGELRQRAAQELRDHGDEATWRTLTTLRVEQRRDLEHVGIQCEFLLGGDVYERLGGERLLQDAKQAEPVLTVLARDLKGGRHWRTRGWALQDTRFVELALAHEHTRGIRDAAKFLLQLLPPEALDSVRCKVAPATPSAGMRPKAVRLTRTDRARLAGLANQVAEGDWAAAWQSLEPLQPKLTHRQVHEQALELAHSSMRRLRGNLERIVECLVATGYQFAHPDDVLCSLSKAEQEALSQLASVTNVPLSLQALWQRVGTFDLSGSHPDWPTPACVGLPGIVEPAGGVWMTDPLVIHAPSVVLAELTEDPESDWPLWPDAHSKAGYGGGPGVCCVVSTLVADVPLVHYPKELGTTLISALRASVSTWCGFPGFRNIDFAWPPFESLRSQLESF